MDRSGVLLEWEKYGRQTRLVGEIMIMRAFFGSKARENGHDDKVPVARVEEWIWTGEES